MHRFCSHSPPISSPFLCFSPVFPLFPSFTSTTTMVVLAHGELEQISLPVVHKPTNFFSDVPVIDLSDPASKARLIGACEELGFFKVTNHGIPMELMAKLEEEALRFFSLPQVEKELSASSPGPFGYGSKKIGEMVIWAGWSTSFWRSHQSLFLIPHYPFLRNPQQACSARS
uniref:Non-haem dioxygenase N-terminal domain-containing protein n=1 Tax=Ananas comosus var. bracteatus TaxID=296719 RepID=A0A6V7QK99_ANACO|nr:unnamed protein product [Ananas comosus var. bracteatus]